MTDIKRYIHNIVGNDLKEKMVFVGGPRQVGKTTFALSFLSEGSEKHPAYINWDYAQSRKKLLDGELPPNQSMIIFDEIHKYARWRNLVKGFYDVYKKDIAFLITGSARLDYYKKGGDSLQGRYHYHRLHPLSLSELNSNPTQTDVDHLLEFGGFPEPHLKGQTRFWRRWQRDRIQRVVYDDIRDLEFIKDISLMELLVNELPNRVGSPLSIRKIQRLLQVAHQTTERWLDIFERMYYSFRIPPLGTTKIRAVKKEQKLYLWDWSLVEDKGHRFENLVACQLLKYCHFKEDTEGIPMELRYIRDTDKREIDFVVLQNNQPLFAVESKIGERQLNQAIPYFKKRLNIPRFYQVHLGQKDILKDGFRLLPFATFCKELNLP
ncbi:MAG: ATP-binding protein [Candidatus Marinimicrobia bacterium]|nr:ATP-binding protein [Candidatus Neomarinimicrobiota bacterium]